jgi:hypothetical protein
MKESHRLLIEWLERHGPDEWHSVGRSWNWDNGFDVLIWIATQPQCDKATAQNFFLMSSPEYFLKFPTREDVQREASHGVGNFDFTMLVVKRWNDGCYKRSEFATVESARTVQFMERGYREIEAEYAGTLPWTVGDDMFAILDGRNVQGRLPPPEVESELRKGGIRF